MNSNDSYMGRNMALLVGGTIESVRKHRLTIRCVDGVVRVAGLQADSEGNAYADLCGRIPQFKGAKRDSLAALKGATITGAEIVEATSAYEVATPTISFTLPGMEEGMFVQVLDAGGFGGYVHVWDKGKRAPSCAV